MPPRKDNLFSGLFSGVANLTPWTFLSRVRNPFVHQALTVLSLSAFVLANLPPVLSRLGGVPWTTYAVFAGALLFLAGYLLYSKVAPPEFGPAGEIWDIVPRMMTYADWYFFIDRIELSENLLCRSKANNRFPPPEGAVTLLKDKIAQARKLRPAASWKEAAGSLFHADLNLRQYDAPSWRLAIAALLGTGALLMVLPTILNVFAILLSRS